MSVLAIDAGTTGVTALVVDADAQRHRPRLRASSRSTSRPRAGSSTTRARSGRPRSPPCAPRSTRSARTATDPRRSASPTSARPSCSGTARRSAPRAARSCGRTGVRRACATSCARTATSRASPRSPACASTPTSRRRSWPGSRTNEPHVWAQVTSGRVAVGTVDSYLVARLTRGLHHVTDASNASRTLLYDIHAGRVEPGAVRRCSACRSTRCPRSCRPTASSGAPTRRCSSASTCRSPGIAGDQQAALFGQACFDAGHQQVHLRHRLVRPGQHRRPPGRLVDRPAHDRRLAAPRRPPRLRARGRGLRHRRRRPVAARRPRDHRRPRPRPRRSPARCPTPAASCSCRRSPASARPTGTRTPAARSSASAAAPPAPTSCARHARGDRVRGAATSSTSWSARAASSLPELAVDGGASANGLLCQLQADALQVPVARAAMLETTGLGAAFLAGLGTGVWAGTDAIARDRAPRRPVRAGRARRPRATAGGGSRVERSKSWAVV